jgi:phenylacetate-CoA ligase
MNRVPQIEFEPADRIKKFQEERLAEMLQYLNENSPFYKQRFKAHDIQLEKISFLEDLAKLPVTTKDDLQRSNWDFVSVSKNQIAEYTSTSGTLGKPVVVPLTRNDLSRLAYNEYISFACADGTPNDLYQLMLTLDRQFMAGIAYYHGIHQLGAGLVRVGPGVPAMQIDTMKRLGTTALVAVPGFLLKLIEYAKHEKISLADTNVKKVICIGESIRTADFKLNALGQNLTENWDVALYGTYASTEMQTAFTECSHGRGGHLHPELIILEVLNDHDEPVDEGVPGEVTITTLGIEALPLLRYKTGDIAAMYKERCACGRNTLRLGPILGRKQQLIKLKGTTLYPPAIFDILNKVSLVNDYVVEAYTNHFHLDELRIYVSTDDQYHASIIKTLQNTFQAHIRVIPEIRLVSQQEIERLQFGKFDRKVRKFHDTRNNNPS